MLQMLMALVLAMVSGATLMMSGLKSRDGEAWVPDLLIGLAFLGGSVVWGLAALQA